MDESKLNDFKIQEPILWTSEIIWQKLILTLFKFPILHEFDKKNYLKNKLY